MSELWGENDVRSNNIVTREFKFELIKSERYNMCFATCHNGIISSTH
jgi:hypothetical protein